jgi:SAM-dependent methyltransferase
MDVRPPRDPEAFKSATRDQWDRCAAGWNAKSSVIRTWLQPSTEAMLQQAAVVPGARVLDVAAGAGDQTLDIASRVGPEGFVLATDLSPAILAFAADNASRHGFRNIETKVADGEGLDVPESSFDVAICRLGLMFFPDPLQGLREMHRALKPGGRASTLVFSTAEQNPCVAILVSTALRHAGLPPRDPDQPGGPLSLGKPGRIDALFKAAGFEDVSTMRLSAPFRLASVGAYLDFVRSSASPIVDLLSRLDTSAQSAAWADIEKRLRAFDRPGGWDGPNELLLTSGRRNGA